MAAQPPHAFYLHCVAPYPFADSVQPVSSMAAEWINEPVEVRVDFCGTRILPRAMHWNNQIYRIRHVNMVHSTQEGATKLFFFSVSDATNYFKLQLNTANLEWKLVELYSGS